MADLVPIRQAAQEFNLHIATLYRYAKDGRLTPYTRGIGRGIYIDRDELRRLGELRPMEEGQS